MVNLVTSATKGNMLNEIQQETATDQFLLQLMEFIMNGFPQKIEKFLSHLHGFWNFRDERSIENRIILKSQKNTNPFQHAMQAIGIKSQRTLRHGKVYQPC